MLFLEIQRNDLVVRGVARRLSHSEQQPQDEERGESVHNAGGGSCGGPEQERSGEHPVDVQAVHQPAVEKMQTRVRPEERGKQHAKLRRRNPQLVLQHRRGDGEVAAIDVIDEHGNRKQTDNNQRCAGDVRTLGWPGSWNEGLATSSPQRPRFATCFGRFTAARSTCNQAMRVLRELRGKSSPAEVLALGWPAEGVSREGTRNGRPDCASNASRCAATWRAM